MIARVALVLVVACGSCLAGELEDRALEYLSSTSDEIGMDVLVMGQIYTELTGDPRGAALGKARLDDVRANDRERYRVLLSMKKPALPPVALRSVDGSSADLIEDGSLRCPLEALECKLSAECVRFLEGVGYDRVVTHQAVTLMFGRWAECELPVDVAERQGAYAARILEELESNAEPSDLFYERLAVLAHLGYADKIREEWLRTVTESQRDEGCFPASPDRPCHPHPTGLVLWLMGHLDR